MSLHYLLLLAAVQGLTEFLPVSSSAHLILADHAFAGGRGDPLIDLAVHVGSLGAVIWRFRHDTKAMALGAARILRGRDDRDGAFAWRLALASLPVLFVGAALHAAGLLDRLRDPTVIAWASIGFGLVLLLADKGRPARRSRQDFTAWDAVVVGLFQMLALIPGASRSGMCVAGARALGYERGEAARIAMMLAVPTIAAAGLIGLFDLSTRSAAAWSAAGLAALMSFAAAMAGIRFFLWLAARTDLTVFVAYRVALGVVVLWLL